MSGCEVTPFTKVDKACSGKCLGRPCGTSPKVWVVAGCEGMISMFEKKPDGHLSPLPQGDTPIFSSIDNFRSALMEAEADHQLQQLIIIGGATDLAWIHSALPAPVAGHIAAEINYPLMAEWFRQTPEMRGLTGALEYVLSI